MNPYEDTHNPFEITPDEYVDEPSEYLGDLSDVDPLELLLGHYSIPGMVADRVLGKDDPAVLPGPAGVLVDILDLDNNGGGKVVPSSGSTSADPRQISSAAQVRQDAADLRKLGYSAPDTGNAYDPGLRAAMRAFQSKAGLTADGLTGPATRAAIAAALGRAAPAPSVLPGLPGVIPASDKKTDPSASVGGVPTVALAIGGVVAVGLVGLLVFGGKKKGSKKS